jgi:serine/threonine-protein kinase
VKFCPEDASTLRSEDSSGDLVGQVIADRYQVTALLGEGGMGRVYVARHVRLPQQVAIKVLHPSLVKDTGAVARFNREAANAARIEHASVARVFDFGETGDGAVYLAMEFVAGQTLRAVLGEGGGLPPARAANLVWQVADGLEAAHRMQIIHRDLKPDNVLVATDEQGTDRVKLVDFGIAKALDSRETKLTMTGMAVGTPEFMSPEQLFGEAVDARTDVYALALVAYQCFTGTLPFVSDTPERALTARIAAKPKPLAVVRPDVAWPAALQTAFDGALATEPADRTPSAIVFADAVVAAVEGWTGAPVLRARTPLSSTAIPQLTPPTGAVAVGASPAPTPAVPAAAVPAATASRTPAPASGGGGSRGLLIGGGALAIVAAVAAFALRGGGSAPVPDPLTTPAPASGAPPASPSTAVAEPAPSAPGPAGGSAPRGAAGAPPPAPTMAGGTSAPPGAPPVSPSARPTAGGEAPTAAEASEARVSLDALRRDLAAGDADAATARVAIPRIERLLPRLATARDSADAYLALVGAYGMAEELARACTPLRAARRLAATPAQERTIEAFMAQLTCTP